MRHLLTISLIGGILLLHAGATIQHLLNDVSYIHMVVNAEEEEETHGSSKLSKHDVPLETLIAFDMNGTKSLLDVYDSSAICRYESNRIELPPEL